ncbi:MAG: hypothetical protein ACI9O0_000648 [Paracoccaceae bacterium]|jgi:hypothetical protein
MRSLLIFIVFIAGLGSPPASAQFFARGQFVLDLTGRLEWLRCSVGQRWSEDTKSCVGEVIPLDHDLIAQAIKQANEQLGQGWRLPTQDELVALVCINCGIYLVGPTIDTNFFPNTFGGSYWTSDANSLSSRHQVSVNFRTGYSYSRFLRSQALAVRLVRDYKRSK